MDRYLSLDALKTLADALPRSAWRIAGIVAGSLILFEFQRLFRTIVIRPRLSLLKDVPGPTDAGSLFFGHILKFITKDPNPTLHEWHKKYGHVFQFRTVFRIRQLVIYDPKALAHVINHAYDFPKPEQALKGFTQLVGPGLLAVEGDDHRRQRKIMNPSFGPTQIRDLMPIFYEKAEELRDGLLRKLGETDGEATLDVFSWMTKTTLDVIGLAGFNYRFNSLGSDEPTELMRAFSNVFRPFDKIPLIGFLQGRYPLLKIIPTERARAVADSKAVLRRVGMDLIQEKTANAESSGGDKLRDRDLLSVMIKANSLDAKDAARMSDEEVLGQIGTMLMAGHETTSNATTWALWDLAKPENRAILERLRAEVTSTPTSQPTMEELNALPYLDAVIKENMRKNSPVDAVTRIAGSDTVIPLSKPYTDRNGVLRHEIRIGKDEPILLPITTLNTSKEIWGEDAKEFNPERWLDPKGHPRADELPGVWGSQMGFHGGPRSCIGYRMAVMEMKVLIFELVRHFDFALPSPAPEIIRKPNIVARPAIELPDGTLKHEMPLIVRSLTS